MTSCDVCKEYDTGEVEGVELIMRSYSEEVDGVSGVTNGLQVEADLCDEHLGSLVKAVQDWCRENGLPVPDCEWNLS